MPPKPKKPKERLMAFIEVDGECWRWTGSINESGYGKMAYEGHAELAHRISWIVYRGEIPKGMFVCHSCLNLDCVNPDHLFLSDDRIASLRMRRKNKE